MKVVKTITYTMEVNEEELMDILDEDMIPNSDEELEEIFDDFSIDELWETGAVEDIETDVKVKLFR